MAIRYPSSSPVDRYRNLYSRDQLDPRELRQQYSGRTPITSRGGTRTNTTPVQYSSTAPTSIGTAAATAPPASSVPVVSTPTAADAASVSATGQVDTIPTATKPAPTQASATSSTTTTPQSSDIDTMFWDWMVKGGLIQGQSGYYADGRNTISGSEYTNAIRIALQSADGAQRRAIVDYLFSQGVAAGDRTYWYTPRGAEDNDLIAAAAKLGTVQNAAGGSGTPDSGTITGDLDKLRQDRLDAVLAGLEADFDLTRGDTRSGLQELLNNYRMSLQENTRETEQTAEQIQEQMAERGIFRSGVTAKNVATGITPYAEQLAMLNSRYSIPENATVESLIGLVGNAEGQVPLGTDIRALLQQYGLINQQEESAKAQARVESEYSELELELMRQLSEAGLT